MNNDELQKAIDDITNNNAAAEAAPVADATAENEQLASELAGAAPAAPEAPAAGFAPAPAPAPEVPAEPGMPPVAGEAVAPEMAEAVAPAVEAAPAVEEVSEAAEVEAPAVPEIKLSAPAAEAAPVASDDDTLNEAYKALYPLLDKVEMPVEEKFDITMKFGEPAKALELAKQIADDTSKANALMKIIEKLK